MRLDRRLPVTSRPELESDLEWRSSPEYSRVYSVVEKVNPVIPSIVDSGPVLQEQM